ncbi:thiamine pyrophosphate-binding protein [Actinoplanes sp. NEAU-A12]|uniref:Thiamine pyrophosphate-binding protein n=1 Tax=Actinoplanes sandaracinus TaxID=3045177 RepID=A0ABT6WL32_9ACTN|nr:thiamine pyrophosphate-binding protein [Actinoplanes sandaracinus]MDI6100438.1 thiamine pyrophosphate-binding protein [Actinoplanes sandaracinus]
MARTGKEAMIEQFLADGITHMFGNPGTVEQGFLDALESFPDFHYILTLQETVAAGVADGYARATGGPAVLQLHSGVGLGNGIGMMYQSKRGHTPLIVIAGEAGVAYDAMDAQMAADLVAMARPVTKWATRVVDSRSLLRILRRAVKIAMTPPRGPVFVALPMDVLDELNDEPVTATVIPHTRTLPPPDLVAQAAALLAGAQRPLLIVGDGVTVSGAEPELARVAEKLGADVWYADSSDVQLPAGHPLSRGALGHMFGPVSRAAVQAADAVLVVGTYVFPEVFPDLTSPFAEDASIVHVDLDAYEIAKNHPVTLGLVADPKPTLAAIADVLDRLRTPEQDTAAAVRIEARRAEKTAAAAVPDDTLIAAFLTELASRAPADLMVFDEALTASPYLTRYLRPSLPGHYLVTRGGSLGVGIPGAVGMKIAHPDRMVVGFAGDGGSMYTYQALWTAARHDVPAVFVVCNNHRYQLLNANIDEYWREQGISGRPHPRSFDLGHPEIDFVGLARSLGADGLRVDKSEQIADAVERMLTTRRPLLIELQTDDTIGR